jgi:uncharacterized protein
VDLEVFELVILRRPAASPKIDDQTAERIQREHLAYLTWLHEAGHTVAAGPLGDQADESMRGLVFYRTGSIEEARRLAAGDPAVRAGRLEADVMTWYCPPGAMTLPGRTVHIPDD